MYAGFGTGRACSGCDKAIGPRDVEYEATYDDGRTYSLHLGCAAFWDAQVRRDPKAAIEDGKASREQSQVTRERSRVTRETARTISKHSAQLCDLADVLARESEAAVEKARRVVRDEPSGQ
jgi:hypothetical protein